MAVAAAAAPYLHELAVASWGHAGTAAASAWAGWQAATGKCKGAIVHATYACAGLEQPASYSRGFGPFALGWGWLLVGMALGILCGLHFWNFVARLEQFIARLQDVREQARIAQLAAPGLALIPPWHGAVRDALQAAQDEPRRTVLRRLCEDGDAALELLAASSGATKRAVLARLLGENLVQTNALAWRL